MTPDLRAISQRWKSIDVHRILAAIALPEGEQ